MNKFFVFSLVVFCMFSANAMADAKLEVDQFGASRITKDVSVWKDVGIMVSADAEKYPLELIFRAASAPGKVIPVEQFMRHTSKGFNLIMENVAKIGLLLNGNQIVVVHDRVMSVKSQVNLFYHFIVLSGGFMLLAVVFRSLVNDASASAFAAFAAVFTFASAAAFAVFTLASAAAFAIAIAIAFAFNDGEYPSWRFVVCFFVLLTASSVCMYFGV